MSVPFIGQIKPWGLNFAPRGWALCNGQTLPINQNQALFSILGTTYGGDGIATFKLPDLRGRTPVHFGGSIPLGGIGGADSHTLTISEVPGHIHAVSGSSNNATLVDPTGALWATDSGKLPFSTAAPDTQLSLAAIGNAGSSQPHSNMQPYLTLNFSIALQGIYPSRN
jgi:microcystin-dependent protein